MAKLNFWERLFPVTHDFYKMIGDQAEATANLVGYLSRWLSSRSEEDYQLLLSEADVADRCRFSMEDYLIEAFVTPFDRQDIYSISIEMDRIVEYAKSTLTAMDAFKVVEDSIIHNMVQQLKIGTDQLAEAIQLLKKDPRKSKNKIGIIRKAQSAIENEYRAGMVVLFNSPDAMQALKYREVYHHIKDAGVNLGYTTDVLHKIIVRVV
ncbi:PhoU family transcriptional regulator [Desulfosporosinus sp. Tol-M]|nr:PhoU family transcriptional regulator [Desulfosporosinus sp. Tol-M]